MGKSRENMSVTVEGWFIRLWSGTLMSLSLSQSVCPDSCIKEGPMIYANYFGFFWNFSFLIFFHDPVCRQGLWEICKLGVKSSVLRSVCMGYWASVRSRWLDIGQGFFCVFMDREEVEVHKLAKKGKKERGLYAAIITEQTWSIKDLLYGFFGNFAWGIERVVPSGLHLSARVANHSLRFGSSCPLAELAL